MKVLDTGSHSAAENMRIDEELLLTLPSDGAPVLHLYSWARPSITYGYFLNPADHLDLAQAEGIDLARRPTGGGFVFHLWDLAFSFLLPSQSPFFSLNPTENYRFVNGIVLSAMEECFHLKAHFLTDSIPSQAFCMATPTQYDVLYEGRKIAGAAQRKKKNGYLHQGTLSLAPPDPILLERLLLSKEVFQNILTHTFAPVSPSELLPARNKLKETLSRKFMAILSPALI